MKTLYKYIICVMLLLLGSMNMVWAAIQNYPSFNDSSNRNKVSWKNGCFELKLLIYDDHDEDGYINCLDVYMSVDNGKNYTKIAYLHNGDETTRDWYYAKCSSSLDNKYGNVFAYGYQSNKSLGGESLLTSSEIQINSYKSNSDNCESYVVIRWFPSKKVLNTTLDDGVNVIFKAKGSWGRNGRTNSSFDKEATVTITHEYSSSFSSNDWQIDGKWGYNLSLNTTSYKFWNIAYVTPTGQPSQWVEFSAQGISTANVSNGTFDLAQYITNNGTIQMYTRVYPHINDSYSSSDPFFYDVASSTISVKNRTLTWNEVEDGDINFYYNDQPVSLTKGQNVPGGAYDVEIGSECTATLSAKCDNIQLPKSGQKFRFNIDYGKHVLALTGQKHDCVVVPYEAPTCTETGNNEHSYCPKCTKTLVQPEWYDELGHNFEDHKCTRCGDIDITLGALCGYNEGIVVNGYSAATNTANPIANQNLSGAKSVSSELLASGEIAYRLNEGQDATVWYQTIGEDANPVLDTNSEEVYAVEHKDTLYINEGTTVPEYTLYDGYDFRTPVTFCAGNASYGRTMRSTWGTIVLPFAIDYATDNGDIQFYYLSGMNDDALILSQFEDGVIPAGTPMVVKKLAEGDELIIESANTEISGTLSPLDYNNLFTKMSLFGTFVNQNYDVKNQDLGRNFYYISNNLFWHATGTIKLNPFRAMFELSTTMANPSFSASSARFSICEEEDFANGVESLNSDRFEEGTLYDLSGRKTDDIKQGEVYMLNGQKVIFK